MRRGRLGGLERVVRRDAGERKSRRKREAFSVRERDAQPGKAAGAGSDRDARKVGKPRAAEYLVDDGDAALERIVTRRDGGAHGGAVFGDQGDGKRSERAVESEPQALSYGAAPAARFRARAGRRRNR